jgi:hypothetical protein
VRKRDPCLLEKAYSSSWHDQGLAITREMKRHALKASDPNQIKGRVLICFGGEY